MISDIFMLAGGVVFSDPALLGLLIFAIITVILILMRAPLNVMLMFGLVSSACLAYLDPMFRSVGVLGLAVGGAVIFYGLWIVIANR